ASGVDSSRQHLVAWSSALCTYPFSHPPPDSPMTVFSATGAYQLDLSAPALNTNPYQTYARLRANRGVHYWSDTPEHRFPVLSRYADGRLAVREALCGGCSWSPVDHTQVCTPPTHIFSPVDVEPVRRQVQVIVATL